jgi:hypothetical protein
MKRNSVRSNMQGSKKQSGGKMLNNRQRKRRQRSNNKRRARQVGTVYLPEINQKPIQTRCLRYQNVNNIPSSLTFQINDIRHMLGFVTNGSTTF